MARNSAENPHSYQKLLKHKENIDDFRRTPLAHSTSTKALRPFVQQTDCKICKVLAKPGDVCKVLHQGLYHKYTSSQDYFYTRDINSLLMKKRKEFCIRYYDDLILDECKERLKGFFKRKEAKALMNEIKQFYTKFKNFPRNFHTHFYHIINSNIRKQRRLEYIRVFHNVNLDEDKGNDSDSQRDYSKDKENFNFMEMLGSSFLQENYKDMSGVVIGDIQLERRRNTEQLIKEIDANFKALYMIPQNSINDPKTSDFSNAVYNKNYMLYSRNDSETAEDMLKQIVNGFKDVDFSRKASMTLAEQVLQKVLPQTKPTTTTKKPENRPSPTLKPRTPNIVDSSPTFHSSKGSIVSTSLNLAAGLYQLQKQNQPLNMAKRPPSNPRTNSQVDSESTSSTLKMNQSKLSEQRKSNSKFSLENLNDLGINRDQIMSNLYQFRSTRTKSGATKSSLSTSKTSSSKTRRPPTVQYNTQGADDSRHLQTGYYLDNKSPSPSPEKKRPREEADKSGTIDFISLSKAGLDSPNYNPMKRSTSNGPGLDLRELASPTGGQSQKSAHKKSSSVVKRSSTITKTHLAHNPSMQNLHVNITHNTSGNYLATEGPASPTIKFTNPLRTTLGNSQILNQRHQSPIEDRRSGEGLGKSTAGQKMKNLDIRALKSTSPKGVENYRMNTMSMSGRFQNLSELSQGAGSFICNQTSLQASKNNSQTLKRKKVTKAEAQSQTFGSKITKRASAIPAHIINNTNNITAEDVTDREKKVKKSLELGDMNYRSYKDLRLQSKEQTPMNLCPSSATSLSKLKVEVKKSFGGSYTVKGSTKDLRLTLKK